jgi:hypothetical protein
VLILKINFKKLIKYYFITFKNKITLQKIIYTTPRYQRPPVYASQDRRTRQDKFLLTKTIQYKARWFQTYSRKIRFTRQDKWPDILSRCR